MRVLALDLGLATGWALWDGERRESGVERFDGKRDESVGMRYVRFNRWLEDVLGRPAPGPTIVAYEQAHMRGAAATKLAYNLEGRVEQFCATRDYEYVGVHSSLLKRWATGRGDAPKQAMLAAARLRHDYAGRDDNEADAILLLAYTRAEVIGTGR